MNEVYLKDGIIFNNLLNLLHTSYGLGETKWVLHAIFRFSKGLFQTSHSKNCFSQMELNFMKPRELCLHNRNTFKNLLNFLHRYHRLGEFKIYLQGIFPEIYRFTIWVINLKIFYWWDGAESEKNKTWVLLGTWPVTKTSFIFCTYITILDMQEGI